MRNYAYSAKGNPKYEGNIYSTSKMYTKSRIELTWLLFIRVEFDTGRHTRVRFFCTVEAISTFADNPVRRVVRSFFENHIRGELLYLPPEARPTPSLRPAFLRQTSCVRRVRPWFNIRLLFQNAIRRFYTLGTFDDISITALSLVTCLVRWQYAHIATWARSKTKIKGLQNCLFPGEGFAAANTVGIPIFARSRDWLRTQPIGNW